jgi:excisionase family DNA binding protein
MTQRSKEEGLDSKAQEKAVNLNSEKLLFENYIATGQAAQLGHLNWMTTVEAAHYLRVSVGSIKNMVYRGQLLPKKLGRLNRFLKIDLDRTLKSPSATKGVF